MPAVTLDELLKLAGLAADPKATRPRRVDQGALPQPVDAPTGGTTLPQPIDAPTGGTALVAPPLPVSAQPPPRSLPPINGEPPPSADTRTRYAGPNTDAVNANLDRVQSFGSSGEVFGSSRQRRTQPRDYIADDLAYARDLENKKSPKWSNIATGITQGLAALEGNQPKQPWEFSGNTRNLNDVYGRLGKELDVQGDQARIEAVKNQYNYRNQQVGMGQQRAMIAHYNASKEYTKGKNPQIDAMYAAAHMDFPDKSPKASGGGRKYHPPIYLPDGTAVQYNDATGKFEDAQYGSADNSSAINNPAMANVTATGADGQEYVVKPNVALSAAAQSAGQQGVADRAQASLNQGKSQFQIQQAQHRQEQADRAASDLTELQAKATADERTLQALEQKRQEQGALYGEDARDLIGYQSRAQMYRDQVKSRGESLQRSYGDLYEVGPDGVPKPKEVSVPSAPAPQTAPTVRPKVDHAKFEKMYAEAKTPEERAKLMKLYQEALKIAGQ